MRSHAADEQLADGGSRRHAVGDDGRRKKKVGEGEGRKKGDGDRIGNAHAPANFGQFEERKNEANARVALDTGTGVLFALVPV
jgi:hypothetical protein